MNDSSAAGGVPGGDPLGRFVVQSWESDESLVAGGDLGVIRVERRAAVDRLVAARDAQARAEVAQWRAVVELCALYGAADPEDFWQVASDRVLHPGGVGTPGVSEFVVCEVAAALGVSQVTAASLIGDGLQLAYRHPRLAQAAQEGRLRVWQAVKVARETSAAGLTLAGARWVDERLAVQVDKVGFARLVKLAKGLAVKADPVLAARRAEQALERRQVSVVTDSTVVTGEVHATIDVVDALMLKRTISVLAERLAETDTCQPTTDTGGAGGAGGAGGGGDSLDVRRAKALGLLATPGRALLLLQSSADYLDDVQTGIDTDVILDQEQPRQKQPGSGADTSRAGGVGAETWDEDVVRQPRRVRGGWWTTPPRATLVVHCTAEALTAATSDPPSDPAVTPATLDTRPDDTRPDDTRPDDAGPNDAGPNDAGPNDTGPNDARPDDTGPEDTGPEDTGPNDTRLSDTGLRDASSATTGSDASPNDVPPVEVPCGELPPSDAGDQPSSDAGDLPSSDASPRDASPRDDAPTGAARGGDHAAVARVEGIGPIPVTRLRELLADSVVTVRPVIDHNAAPAIDRYEIPAATRAAVINRTGHDAFPYSTIPADRCDLDHTIPYRHTSPNPEQTRIANLTPLSRRAHRAKTHGRWNYLLTDDGYHLWTSPLGKHYLTGPHGTTSHDTALETIVQLTLERAIDHTATQNSTEPTSAGLHTGDN